ncbi:phosphotransferase [Nonomuraea harbinensis]|uniref:Phosphotransferase n=1 Tax=Nonomuraea harbinensis TaxID=1286938 RepID=A0ABW1BLV0_9ACTN|nr:phosphotransferase [Nonomuraea harbinensis]
MRVGTLIASGHDCLVFEAGAGKVVKRSRHGRSLEQEASIMRHARRNGIPTPEVFDADGPDLLMERLEGPSLRETALRRPDRLASYGRLLAELLRTVARVRAPGWLQGAGGCPGNRLLHLDLHPANVIVTAAGPRIVDWANAARGAPGADVACTWLILATTAVPEAPVPNWQEIMLGAFLDAVDVAAARPYLRVTAARWRADRAIEPAEQAEIDAFLSGGKLWAEGGNRMNEQPEAPARYEKARGT